MKDSQEMMNSRGKATVSQIRNPFLKTTPKNRGSGISASRPIRLYASPEMARQMGLVTDRIDGSDEMTESANGYRELMCDVVCAKHNKPIRLNRAEYPAEVVRSRLLKLNSEHLEYVVDKLQENPNYNGIDNVRAYMLTCLFNAPVTCGTHYQQMANHDMFGGGWDEKEINIKCV